MNEYSSTKHVYALPDGATADDPKNATPRNPVFPARGASLFFYQK